MTSTTHLLIIDAQNDFCDLPADRCPVNPATGMALAPALPVPGAHADMQRLGAFLRSAVDRIDAVTLTMDSHYRLDIAHTTFWQKADGSPVEPFTQITSAQVQAGTYRPRQASSLARATDYLYELEMLGRYHLIAWPVHCEIGSWGHNLHADVMAACNVWEEAHATQAMRVLKGTSPWTEHYSAVMAEVPDTQDAGTQLNRRLIDRLQEADTLLIAGEAGSHCVRATTEDLMLHLPARPSRRVVLLTDCMSPVAGFEAMQSGFLDAMRKRGVTLATSLTAFN